MKLRIASVTFLLVAHAHAQTSSPPTSGSAPTATGTTPTAVPAAAPNENAAPAPTTVAPAATTAAPAAAASSPPAVEDQRKSSKIVERLEAGGFLGWGIQLDGQATRPFGLALGLRGGAVLPNHIYAGLMLGVFAGQSSEAYVYGPYQYSVSLWQSQLGVEGGYDFDFGKVTLRPYAGLGVNRTIISLSGYYSSVDLESTTDLYVNAGGMAHLKITDRIYGGIDSRFDLVTSGPARTALVVAASGGVMFF